MDADERASVDHGGFAPRGRPAAERAYREFTTDLYATGHVADGRAA